jgi:hypothetical protein
MASIYSDLADSILFSVNKAIDIAAEAPEKAKESIKFIKTAIGSLTGARDAAATPAEAAVFKEAILKAEAAINIILTFAPDAAVKELVEEDAATSCKVLGQELLQLRRVTCYFPSRCYCDAVGDTVDVRVCS